MGLNMINQQKTLNAIGATLAGLRKRQGFQTIRDFARRHKLPEIQYWRVENGKTNITMKTLIRLLNIHKIPLTMFFALVQNTEALKKK